MSSFDVTKRFLSFGARDSTTGWLRKIYEDTTIRGTSDPSAIRKLGLPAGNHTATSRAFYTANDIKEGDRLVFAFGDEWEVESVGTVSVGNNFIYNGCKINKLIQQGVDRPATSGTWHTDSDSVKTDPRNRMKTWLDGYIAYTAADYVTMFSGVDYPLKYEFVDQEIDLICSIDTQTGMAEYDYNNYPYKFNETTTFTLTAQDTATLTATNILESFEQEIRHVATDHPYGSLRRFTSTKPERVDVGGVWLWQNTITMQYIRDNDEYTDSGMTITWGPSASPTGTYTIPNITSFTFEPDIFNVRLPIPGRIGSALQKLGAPDYTITMRCDLNFGDWKRTQGGAKTDVLPEQVFMDIYFNGMVDQTYQTLDLGWGGTIPVTLEMPQVRREGLMNELTLTFKVYSAAGASAYKTWFGINP